MLTHHILIALTALSLSTLASAQDSSQGMSPQRMDPEKTRAEVRAELEIAQQSGLHQVLTSDFYDPVMARSAQALYEKMIRGSEYQTALRRQQARQG